MLRKLIVTAGVVTAAVLSMCLQRTSELRSLELAELWATSGGGTAENKCCSQLTVCAGPAEHCDDWDSYFRCEEAQDVSLFGTSDKGCNSDKPGTTCTYAETTHLCKRTYPECIWDFGDSECKIDPAHGFTDGHAPDSCSPDCT